MGSLGALIVPLLSAVGDLIKDALSDDKAGNTQLARTKLEYFTSLTRAMLKSDRAEAEAILNRRFPDEVTHVEHIDDDEVYGDDNSITAD